ncbi:MAG TPA: GON domain-containing protein [Kofleriaceae bacterium]|nr:GON domain-containing protein [Kofleriaceae bacterium]
MKAIKTIAVASLLTACTAVTETPQPAPAPTGDPGMPMVRGDVAVVEGAAKGAATCADVVAADPAAADGDYTLYLGGDRSKPWQAYCADMAKTPVEYLPLVMLLGDHNFSQYTAGGSAPGTNVRTSYMRVRIDPATLKIDIGDQRFATSTGGLDHPGDIAVTSMPFGIAMSCGSTDGLANIDLTGTPFAIAEGFAAHGAGGHGQAAMDVAQRVAVIEGGGYCGWVSTADAPFNPYNAAHAWAIQLGYAP